MIISGAILIDNIFFIDCLKIYIYMLACGVNQDNPMLYIKRYFINNCSLLIF